MESFGFEKSTTIEIPVATGNTLTRIGIPDQPNLRWTRLIAVEAFTNNDVTKSQPGSLAVLGAAAFLQASLVLYTYQPGKRLTDPESQLKNGTFGEYLKWMPLNSIHRVQNAANDPFVRQLPWFDNVYVQWEKSYIQLSTGLAPGADSCFYLQVFYSDK